MNDNLRKMFETVKDPEFKGWEKVDTISEDELFNSTLNQDSQPIPLQHQPLPDPGQNLPIPNNPPPVQGGFNIGSFLNAEMAVNLVDTIASTGAVIAAKKLTGKRLNKSKFKATAEEKAQMEIPMKAALVASNITITNPFEALFWGIVVVYGSKVALEVIDEKMNKEDTVIGDEKIDNTSVKPKRGRPKK